MCQALWTALQAVTVTCRSRAARHLCCCWQYPPTQAPKPLLPPTQAPGSFLGVGKGGGGIVRPRDSPAHLWSMSSGIWPRAITTSVARTRAESQLLFAIWIASKALRAQRALKYADWANLKERRLRNSQHGGV